jgi:hypothetical protein
MPGDRRYEINRGIKIVNEAKEMEKNGQDRDAANRYKEAGKIFKECGEKILYAKCLQAHYCNMIKYYLEGRDIEIFSSDTLENYIKRIVNGIIRRGLDKFDEYELLIAAYRELEKIFAENKMEDKANYMYYKKSELYAKYFWLRALKKDSKFRTKIKDIFKSVFNLIFYWFCGHGERPVRALLISISFIFIFSGIFFGFKLLKHSCSSAVPGLIGTFYFSVVTFTTLGFGDIVPKNAWGQAFVAVEVMMGYLMLGALIAIIIRKITR